MTPTEARDLLLAESLAVDGVLIALRMGDDPGPERMGRLIAALRVIFDQLQGATVIDRELAYALHGFAVYPDMHVSSWARQGRKWRPGLVENELPALGFAIESIFAGAWQEAHD